MTCILVRTKSSGAQITDERVPDPTPAKMDAIECCCDGVKNMNVSSTSGVASSIESSCGVLLRYFKEVDTMVSMTLLSSALSRQSAVFLPFYLSCVEKV
jgi:hypothetical protein